MCIGGVWPRVCVLGERGSESVCWEVWPRVCVSPGNLLLSSVVQMRLGRFGHHLIVHPTHVCARKSICLGGCAGVSVHIWTHLCASMSVSSHLWSLAFQACTALCSASGHGHDWTSVECLHVCSCLLYWVRHVYLGGICIHIHVGVLRQHV